MKRPSAARTPVVLGAYEATTRAAGRSCQSIMADAVVGAIADAGAKLADVDAVFTAHTWEEPELMEAVSLAERLGVEPTICETVSLGGAGPCGMVARAAAAIQAGACEMAVLAAASNRASGLGREAAITALRDVAHRDTEVPFGAYIPALYALLATRHMHAFGTTPAQLAEVAVQLRANAASRPLATKTSPIGVDDVLQSAMIAAPLHLLDCCLVTDFGAALVMVDAERAASLAGAPIPVLGWGESHGPLSLTRNPQPETSSVPQRAATAALRRARLVPADIDSAQLYDSFTITVLLLIEAIGLCGLGEAGPFVASGATAATGSMPINTNGGMLSYATGGMFHITEAVAALRGQRAQLLSRSVDTAFVHGVGGVFSSHVSLVLGSERTA